jgi:hypothetical protein
VSLRAGKDAGGLAGRGHRVFRGLGLIFLLVLLDGCTVDLTDPPLVGDGPARLGMAFTVMDVEGEEGCWSVRVTARPLLREGRLAPVPDSTVYLAGEAYLPLRRPHELASFVYGATPRCGERPEFVSIQVPFLEGVEELNWPLGSLPMPWQEESNEVLVPRDGIVALGVPHFALPLDLPGEPRLDWTARVARAPDAPDDQEDHQLLTNSAERASNSLSIGAPFTSVAGTVWEVRWGIFSRLDLTTASQRLEAALEYGVFRVTRFRVVEGEEEGEGEGPPG